MIQKIVAYCCLSLISYGAIAQPVLDSGVTADKLKDIVYFLAADSLRGRYSNSTGSNIAAAYIAQKFEAAGVKKISGMNGYFSNVDAQPDMLRNVLGVLPGTGPQKDEIILLSAHYDHLGTTATWKPGMKKDVVYNGANDDASGVAAMLMLAEYFGKTERTRTIMFAAFSGEELGLLGSKETAYFIKPKMIIAQINLEMLGRKGTHQRPFVTGNWHSDLRNLLNKNLADSLQVKKYFEEDVSGTSNLFQRSDNFPFAQLGIPAHTIMLTTDTDKYYHTLKDEAATLDYDNMADIVRHVAVAITPLINGKQTPERINASQFP